MPNWVLAVSALLALIFFIYEVNYSNRKKKPKLVVDLYGDSVLYGYPYPPNQSPKHQIELKRKRWKVIDHTAGGLDSLELLNGYQTPDPGLPEHWWHNGPQLPFAKISRKGVDVVVLQVGFNDAFHNLHSFESNLRTLIRILLAEGSKVVLTGVFNVEIDVPYRDEYNAITRDLAREFNLVHAGWGEDYTKDDVHPDTIHRTLEAQTRMTNNLIKAIEKAAST